MEESIRWKSILDIVTVCRRMWQKGWVANHDGNVSLRLGEEFLATPTGVSKADIIPEIILTLGSDGKKLAGPGKPFSEINLHLAGYRARGDVTAVVHAHPPYATARGACNLALERSFIPESVVSIGNTVPVIPYTMPDSVEGTDLVAKALAEFNVIMIAGNGVLAIGTDVMQAYLRIELVEHLTQMDFIARQLGTPVEVPAEDVTKLLEKRSSAGLDPRHIPKQAPKIDTRPVLTDHDNLRRIIADEIKSVLGS